MISTSFSFSGSTAEDMQTGKNTVSENIYYLWPQKKFFDELKRTNALAEKAGWKAPKYDEPPIKYDMVRKCRIVTKVK